jgi:crossover junction endodeoxyribonuclease RuvC
MIILGVDPGTLVTGYGILETKDRNIVVLACGAISNSSTTVMPRRLKLIFDTLCTVIEKFHPDEFALETAFYGKNAQSALKLGHARGVAMLAGITHNIETHEYSPREVKKAIVGNGTASKEQVQYMVKSLLQLKEAPTPYDVTDALAVALCHMQRKNSGRSKSKSWKAFVAEHPEKLSRPKSR